MLAMKKAKKKPELVFNAKAMVKAKKTWVGTPC